MDKEYAMRYNGGTRKGGAGIEKGNHDRRNLSGSGASRERRPVGGLAGSAQKNL